MQKNLSILLWVNELTFYYEYEKTYLVVALVEMIFMN